MEDPIIHRPEHHRRRVRVPRRRTRWQRLKKFLEMPHLKRRDRNQRVAIVSVVFMLLLYLGVIRPVVNLIFPPAIEKAPKLTPVKAAPRR